MNHLIVVLKKKEDLIPLFAIAPTAPLFHLKKILSNGEEKHYYFCSTEDGTLIMVLPTKEKIKKLEFPKVFSPKEVHIVDVEKIVSGDFSKLVEMLSWEEI